MKDYVGLDVSVKLTAICIVDEAGAVVRETVLVTEPLSLASYLEGAGVRFWEDRPGGGSHVFVVA